jgi:hypothetical protein
MMLITVGATENIATLPSKDCSMAFWKTPKSYMLKPTEKKLPAKPATRTRRERLLNTGEGRAAVVMGESGLRSGSDMKPREFESSGRGSSLRLLEHAHDRLTDGLFVVPGALRSGMTRNAAGA